MTPGRIGPRRSSSMIAQHESPRRNQPARFDVRRHMARPEQRHAARRAYVDRPRTGQPNTKARARRAELSRTARPHRSVQDAIGVSCEQVRGAQSQERLGDAVSTVPSEATGTLPLVVFLHGSGGLGTDNEKQMGLGNIFGTRVWALPENQKTYPVLRRRAADRSRVGPLRTIRPRATRSRASSRDWARARELAFEIIDALRREFPIDERRIYITGQSMGGGGAWHMTAQRPQFFAAAVTCCGSGQLGQRDGLASARRSGISTVTPTRPFPSRSHARASPRCAKPAHIRCPPSTPASNTTSWEWAYTEPALVTWLFAQRSHA